MQRSPVQHLRRSLTALAVAALTLGSFTASPASADHWSYEDTVNRPDLHQGHADVLRLYWAFFDRQPDVDGAQYWITQYDSCGWDTGRIAQFFSSSPEFEATYGAPDDEAFLDLVYANVFGRSPDAGGEAFWLARLAGGQTRGSMVADLSFSPEFRSSRPLPSDGIANTGCTSTDDPHHDPGSLLIAFSEAWQTSDWTTMATFATTDVVIAARTARTGLDEIALGPAEVGGVLDTCGHPGSGEWSCVLPATSGSGPDTSFQIVLLGDEDGFSVIFLTETT